MADENRLGRCIGFLFQNPGKGALVSRGSRETDVGLSGNHNTETSVSLGILGPCSGPDTQELAGLALTAPVGIRPSTPRAKQQPGKREERAQPCDRMSTLIMWQMPWGKDWLLLAFRVQFPWQESIYLQG